MTITEQAERLVAAGNASTIESAVWSLTHSAGYVDGRSDALNVWRRDITGASEGYAAGYDRGFQWGSEHAFTF